MLNVINLCIVLKIYVTFCVFKKPKSDDVKNKNVHISKMVLKTGSYGVQDIAFKCISLHSMFHIIMYV